jgi:hypothetical protein
MEATEADLEVLARLLERAGILVGVDPGHGPDHMSIQFGINRLGNMLRDAEGRNKTLERCLHHEEYKARSLASEKQQALNAKYEAERRLEKIGKDWDEHKRRTGDLLINQQADLSTERIKVRALQAKLSKLKKKAKKR